MLRIFASKSPRYKPSPATSWASREYGEPQPDGRGTLIPLRLTQTDLGGLVGASRVRVNQALGYYRKRGDVSLDKEGRITVHDEEALARRAR
jgi:CRP/FNR family cyclic AMP-dependent transcriptional regulator